MSVEIWKSSLAGNGARAAKPNLAALASIAVMALALGPWIARASSSTGSDAASRPVCAARLGLRPENHNPRSAQLLVPAAPREVLLCRYYGSYEWPAAPKGKIGTLAAERLVRREAPARSIAGEFDSLQPFSDHPVHCPRDSGAALYALFRYDHQRQVPVKAGLGGCRLVNNGRLDNAFFLSNDLSRWLSRLTAVGNPGA